MFIDKSLRALHGIQEIRRVSAQAVPLAVPIFEVAAGLCAVAVVCLMIADPTLPPDAHFGPLHGDVLGQAADFTLQPAAGGESQPAFTAHVFNGNIAMTVREPGGAIELAKSYGFPILLLYVLFAAVVLDCLRRLFRNVGRGESFSTQSVRLVQIVGGSLIVFSVIATIGESWFTHAMFSYLMQHTDIAVGGTPVSLPPVDPHHVRVGHWLPFGRATFWSGLLVLALAEVFRQGLALKRENELTV